MFQSAVGDFAESIAALVAEVLGEQLVGVYVMGSAALGDLQPTSDLDMAAVARGPVEPDDASALTSALLHRAAGAPVRGLEFVLYTAEQAANPDGSVTLNVNAGPRMQTQVGVEDDFWFVIDASILRGTAVALAGPPVTEVFGAVAPDVLAAALDRSLRWHRDHGDRPHATVLTACRTWRYSVEGVWSSKSEAGEWAGARAPDAAELVTAALAVRRRARDAEIGAADARAFVDRVRAAVRVDAERPAS